MAPADPSSVGLVAGVALAAQSLRQHLPDGLRANLKNLKNDPIFCVFLAGG
jgi:hypothetical protein